MKKTTFNTKVLNFALLADLENYMDEVGERKGSVKARSYMHRTGKAYTSIRQTKTLIVVEWVT
tara:strand:+ start:265 stop:453 length:189 start_codon:yes stop_codon:yes gene_type:complete